MGFTLLMSLAWIGADPLPEASQKELKRLEGQWVVQSLEAKGRKHDVSDVEPRLIMEIKDNKWIFTGKEKAEIIALDPTTDPKCLDMKSIEEGRKGQVDEAIFKLEGDTLTVCLYQGKGKQRPTKFETSPDLPDTVLAVFKRAKKE